MSAQTDATAVVTRWIDHSGYGFARLDDGRGDVFVHRTSIMLPGDDVRLSEGQRIRGRLAMGDRGRWMMHDVVPLDAGAEVLSGVVKCFTLARGWGFVTAANGDDVFFLQSRLEGVEAHEVGPGMAVTFRCVQGDRGPMAVEVRRA